MMNSLIGMVKRRTEQYPPSMRPPDPILVSDTGTPLSSRHDEVVDPTQQLRSAVRAMMDQNKDNEALTIRMIFNIVLGEINRC